MLAFRSEAHVDEWCRRHGAPRQPSISLEQQWQLAVAWYGDRLSPESRRPSTQEAETIFAEIGLTAPAWDLGIGGVD